MCLNILKLKYYNVGIENLLKAFKTEIKPTQAQKIKIEQSIGICRYLYNSYLAKNIEIYNEFK